VPGDGTSWLDWDSVTAADHLSDAAWDATEPLSDVALLRYTRRWLDNLPTSHPRYWRRDGKLLVLAGWLAVEQEKKR
jgi:hypothetical protein